MKKIEFGEGCFGPFAIIDDESLHLSEYDRRDPELIRSIKKDIISELVTIMDDMDINDWIKIIEIIESRSYFWELNYDDGGDVCDQCGNYNYSRILVKESNDFVD